MQARNLQNLFKPFYILGIALILVSHNGFTAVDKITSSTPLLLKTPTSRIPEELLLDVGIPTLNDGLYLTDENDTVFPEVRFAEAIYFRKSTRQSHGKKWRLGRNPCDTQ